MSLISGQKSRSMRSGVAPSVQSGGSAMAGTYADKKAKALAAKNTVVLSYDELERIKGMCT